MGHESDTKQEQALRFASQVCETLECGRVNGRFNKLYVVAAPGFLGMLRKQQSSSLQKIIAGEIDKNLAGHDFGGPPHALIVPGRLHFHETEALRTLADCPDEALDKHNPVGELDRLIEKYSEGCRRVIRELDPKDLPRPVTLEDVKALTGHAANYLDDGEYYQTERKATALASVSYAEGILDALKLLGLVEFEW